MFVVVVEGIPFFFLVRANDTRSAHFQYMRREKTFSRKKTIIFFPFFLPWHPPFFFTPYTPCVSLLFPRFSLSLFPSLYLLSPVGKFSYGSAILKRPFPWDICTSQNAENSYVARDSFSFVLLSAHLMENGGGRMDRQYLLYSGTRSSFCERYNNVNT